MNRNIFNMEAGSDNHYRSPMLDNQYFPAPDTYRSTPLSETGGLSTNNHHHQQQVYNHFDSPSRQPQQFNAAPAMLQGGGYTYDHQAYSPLVTSGRQPRMKNYSAPSAGSAQLDASPFDLATLKTALYQAAEERGFQPPNFTAETSSGSLESLPSASSMRRRAGSFHKSETVHQPPAATLRLEFGNIGGERRSSFSSQTSSGEEGGGSSSGSSSQLGLTDISRRLEATFQPGGWTPLGSIGSKSPSPLLQHHSLAPLANPIEEYIFLSDNDGFSPKKMGGGSPFKNGGILPASAGEVKPMKSGAPTEAAAVPVELPPQRPSLAADLPAQSCTFDAPPTAELMPPPQIAAAAPCPAPSFSSSPTLKPLEKPPTAGLSRATSWSQVVRTAGAAPRPAAAVVVTSPPSPAKSVTPPPEIVPALAPEYHRGPRVDPRWPVAQQLFLGPIPVSVTWDEIRNTFYNKVARHQILHTYVQSKPVNDVVYGQIVFDKAALAAKIIKDGPIKVFLFAQFNEIAP